MDHQRYPGHGGSAARHLDRLGRVFPDEARPVSQLDANREVGVFRDRAGAALRIGIGAIRQLAAARRADDADRRQIDKGAHPRAHLIIEHLAQPWERRRAGAAGVAQRRDPAVTAVMVGVPAHVVGVDEDMRVDVDQAGGNVETARADRAVGLRLGQRRFNRDDFAAADRDIGLALQAGAGIEHLAVLDQ